MHRLRAHVSYANVAATLALLFAMSGGALAANRYLLSSAKQISPKLLKQLKGQKGAAGPQGSAGPAGAQGAQGTQGPEGKAGNPGSNGKEGAPGAGQRRQRRQRRETGQRERHAGVPAGKQKLDRTDVELQEGARHG